MKRVTLLLIFIFTSLSLSAQTALVGMTKRGGMGFGNIFGIGPGDTSIMQQYSMPGITGRIPEFTEFIQASNGKLYGMTGYGGLFDMGVIFEYDMFSNTYSTKFLFSDTLGYYPFGSLVQASNGKLYGLTNKGGNTNRGVIFEYDLITNTYLKKFDFDVILGASPSGSLIQASNGKLYGMTKGGGANMTGVIFEYDYINDIYTKKYDFSASLGYEPKGSLIEVTPGKFYGMTMVGGANASGVIFEYDVNTGIYTKKIDLNAFLGSWPEGSLVQAGNGKLYGLTTKGGANNGGTLFEYDYLTNICTKKIDFSNNSGYNASGSLMQASNGKLYGMTMNGGVNNQGVIFEYDYLTNTYIKKIELTDSLGIWPKGSLMQTSIGKLYGMTSGGGLKDFGVIFEYDYASNTYVKKIDLYTAPSGSNPLGSLIQASNGKLYGMTSEGGVNEKGVIFEYDFLTNTYAKKIDLSNNLGYEPRGSLMQASNGKLYGMTQYGGTYDLGVIFEYDYNTNTYVKKVELFTAKGTSPWGSLIEASNGKLYGMTRSGGTYDNGTIFEYNYISNNFNKKFDFLSQTSGGNPSGSLMEASNGKLYGLTVNGGSFGRGVIFEYDYISNTFTKMVDLTDSTGKSPLGSLIQATNGNLYGMTVSGGTNDEGVIFEYDFVTNTYIKKVEFDSVAGKRPTGSLMQATNGKLYGMPDQGTYLIGIIIEYDYVNNTYIDKFHFSGPNGAWPIYNHLIEINIPSGTHEITDTLETTVYPNPANQKATVRFKSLRSGRAEIRVMDLAGRTVIQTVMNTIRGMNHMELNLNPCNPGLYLLQVTDAVGNSAVKRLAVE